MFILQNKDIRTTACKRNSKGPIPLPIFWQNDEQNSFRPRPPENRMTDNYTRTITDELSFLHISEVTLNVKIRVLTHKKYCKRKSTYYSLNIFIYAETASKNKAC
jgi:hypothetical protein